MTLVLVLRRSRLKTDLDEALRWVQSFGIECHGSRFWKDDEELMRSIHSPPNSPLAFGLSDIFPSPQ